MTPTPQASNETASRPRALRRDELQQRPVTGREVVLRDDESIVSTTDTRGVITYVNRYFVEVSGYTERELIGQPHNLIRHPDMPAAAFADMWSHLKQGRPWVGMVKNRCKNGDHYWVQANVTPVLDAQGVVTGYMSVRRKIDAAQIAEAERWYADLRDGRPRNAAIRNGRVIRRPWGERLNPLWKLGLATRLHLLALFAPILALATWYGVDHGASSTLLATLVGVAALAGHFSAWWLGRDLVGRAAQAAQALRAIAGDDFRGAIDVHRDDEIGRILLGLKSMQIRMGFQVERMRIEGAAAARINQALDVAATNVMVADADLTVVFANQALLRTLREAESRIATALPGFRADAIVGGSIDRFHAKPEHQRRMLAGMRAPYQTRIVLAGLTFDLLVTPVIGDRGVPIGFVVEWRNRTEELQIEAEVERVVDGASHGQLDARIGEAGKQGYALNIAKGVNAILGSVSTAVDEIQRVLQALAAGDLTRRCERQMEGAFGDMATNANETVDRLSGIVGRIQQAVGIIHTGAGEIAAGNADLAARTEQQAANLEETASSMEELTSTVQANAESARHARQLSQGAAGIAREGGQTVAAAVSTMGRITDASRQIGEIIGVIDGIAFQTNILALNAAVEAARAGEQGRGFAVVASEVRALAQRSAQSAREIKALIATSVEAVEQGGDEVRRAGESITALVDEVGKVSKLVAEISAATDEQAVGLVTVSQTVNHLDNTTQQNAALVEEASAAASSMEDQARALAEAVAAFRLRR